MLLRPPPLWWPRHEPNLLLSPMPARRGAARRARLGQGLETFPDFPLVALWRRAGRLGAVPTAGALPGRVAAALAGRWADAFETLIPELCWTDGEADALDRAAAAPGRVRRGGAVAIAPAADHAAAWLAETRERRSA
jgi:hypothetical protein